MRTYLPNALNLSMDIQQCESRCNAQTGQVIHHTVIESEAGNLDHRSADSLVGWSDWIL